MLTDYLQAAMRRAHYEILPEDRRYYGEIGGFDGVWASADTLEACRDELRDVLEEWVLFQVSQGLALPTVDGNELAIRKVA